jgi:hypothetical protein
MKYYAVSKHNSLHFQVGDTKTGLEFIELTAYLRAEQTAAKQLLVTPHSLAERLKNGGTTSIRLSDKHILLVSEYEA